MPPIYFLRGYIRGEYFPHNPTISSWKGGGGGVGCGLVKIRIMKTFKVQVFLNYPPVVVVAMII